MTQESVPGKPGIRYIPIAGILRCKTGTRIGGSKEELEIGGMDSPIIRDPVDKLPYIPGSSLKGKMRSLLEIRYKRVAPDGSPCNCGQTLDKCPICTIFGPHKRPHHQLGPSRLIVRDALITDESKERLARLIDEGLLYAEVKMENIINRNTSTARDPRSMERVPKDTKFHLSMSLRLFDRWDKQGDEQSMKKYIKEALDMLQQDYLGGSGTRGYGWVEIIDLKGLDGA